MKKARASLAAIVLFVTPNLALAQASITNPGNRPPPSARPIPGVLTEAIRNLHNRGAELVEGDKPACRRLLKLPEEPQRPLWNLVDRSLPTPTGDIEQLHLRLGDRNGPRFVLSGGGIIEHNVTGWGGPDGRPEAVCDVRHRTDLTESPESTASKLRVTTEERCKPMSPPARDMPGEKSKLEIEPQGDDLVLTIEHETREGEKVWCRFKTTVVGDNNHSSRRTQDSDSTRAGDEPAPSSTSPRVDRGTRGSPPSGGTGARGNR